MSVHNIGFIFEIIITACIVSLQLKYFVSNKKAIRILGDIFPNRGETEPVYKIVREDRPANLISSISSNGISQDYDLIAIRKDAPTITEHFRKILDATNKYLRGNKGAAADFNILKNIAERISEAEENAINARISLPLFIGLMGTFIGVIVGIVFIYIKGINDNSINNFLGGVFIAMIASLFGLGLTTWSNSFSFKEAKVKRDRNKNDYYTFLQAELLPILNRDLSNSLITLKGTLERFSKTFSDELFKNLGEFNQKFESNNKKFGENTNLVINNINAQKEFLDKVNKLGFKRIVEANLEIFSKIDEKKDFFDNLHKAIEKSQKVFDEISNAGTIANNLLSKIQGFEDNIKELTANFTRNEIVTQKYIEDVFGRSEELKKRYELVVKHINEVDDENNKYLSDEKEAIHRLTSGSLSELEKIAEQLKQSISELDVEIKQKLTRSFDFSEEKTKYAELLNTIKSDLHILTETLKVEIASTVQTHKGAITSLSEESLNKYQDSLDHIRKTLVDLEGAIKRAVFVRRGKGHGSDTGNPIPDPIPWWRKILPKSGQKT